MSAFGISSANAVAGLGRLRWLTVAVPAVALIAFDYLRHYVFPYDVLHGWTGLLLLWLLAIAGILAFSHAVFTIIRSMEQEVLRRNQELETTAAVATSLGHPLSLEQILEGGLEKVLELTNVKAGTVCVLDESRSELIHMAYRGLPAEVLGPLNRAKLSQDPIGSEVVETARAVVLPNLWEDVRVQDAARKYGFRSAVSIPLVAEGKVVGVMALASVDKRCFPPAEVSMLIGVGSQLGMAIENANLLQKVQRLATLDERERIAREMHDGLAQVLGYVNTKTQAARKLLSQAQVSEAEEALEQLEGAAREVYADVREAILGLRTTTTPGQGLAHSIREYVEWFSRQNSIRVQVIEDEHATALVEPGIEIQLIRIVQEALSNVRKHARAEAAWVELAAGNGELRLSVKDNGQGFDPERVARGPWPQFGLQTMRERAESVGGAFEVSSVVGQGTIVTVSVPRGGRPK